MPKKDNRKKRAGFFTILYRIAYYSVTLIVLLVLILAILFQSYTVRNIALNKATQQLDKILVADLQIEDLKLNLDGSVELVNVRMITVGDTLAYIPYVEAKIKYVSLLSNKLEIKKLTLDKPKVKLLRSATDSTWNTEHIAHKKEKEPKEKSGNFIIIAYKLILNDGEFLRLDSLADLSEKRQINYSNLKLDDLNLRLNAKLELGDKNYSAHVDSLSFTEQNTNFKLDNFYSDLRLIEGKISAENSIFKTQYSNVKFDAIMSNFNVLSETGNKNFDSAKFDIELISEKLFTSDIEYFAETPLGLKDTIYNINLDSEGTLERLNVEKLTFNTNKNDVVLKAELYNLTKPENFEYRADIVNSKIDITELNSILEDIDLSSLKDIKEFEINYLTARGDVSSAEVEFLCYANESAIESKASVIFANILDYNAEIVLQNFKLQDYLETDLTFNTNRTVINATGNGSDIKKIMYEAEVSLGESKFNNIKIDNALIKSHSNGNAKFVIDTIYTLFSDYYTDESLFYTNESRYIAAGGFVDISDEENPSYTLNGTFEGINLRNILENPKMPYVLSGDLGLTGRGIDPDSIKGNIYSNIYECYFKDRALLPFEITGSVRDTTEQIKILELNSEFINARFKGNYSFNDLMESFKLQGLSFQKFFADNIKPLVPSTSGEVNDSTFQNLNVGEFPEISGTFNADIKNIYPLTFLFTELDLQLNAGINIRLISEDKSTKLEIDSINIRNFRLSNDSTLNIYSNPIYGEGSLSMVIKDSLPTFENLNFNIKNNEDIFINNLKISNAKANVSIEQDHFKYKVSSDVMEDLGFLFSGDLNFQGSNLNLISDSLKLRYNDYYWSNEQNINIDYNSNITSINNFSLRRDSSEVIKISGSFKDTTNLDLRLDIEDLELSDIPSFLAAQKPEGLKELTGKVDKFSITAKNNALNPEIELVTDISSLGINKNRIGDLNSKMNFEDQILKGYLDIFDNKSAYSSYIAINISNFYYDLGLPGDKAKDTSIALNLEMQDLSASVLSPFVPGLSRFTGKIDGQFDISGENLENIEILGNANLNKVGFILDQTNIQYFASGPINFDTEHIQIDELIVSNAERDLSNGKAIIDGTLKLGENGLDNFYISIQSERFKVLSDASQASMPDLYGDLIISTTPGKMVFSGSLEKPELTGNVNVLKGDIKMPQAQAAQATRTLLDYEVLGEGVRYTITTQKDDKEKKAASQEETNIAEAMLYDLDITLINQVSLIMDIGPLGELFALIGSGSRESVRYYKKPYSEAELYGDFRVMDNSTLKSFKILETSGKINFPTGEISNPRLDLIAEYRGVTLENDEQKNFTVTMVITGSAEKPEIQFSYTIDGELATGDEQQIEEDALYLLITGNTKNQSESLVNYQSGLQSGATYLSTGLLSSFLSGTGVIQSADIDFNEQWDPTLKLSGNVEGIFWKWEGEFENNQITVEVPFSSIETFKQNQFWRNFAMQFSKATNVSEVNRLDQNATNWEFKIRFGSSR